MLKKYLEDEHPRWPDNREFYEDEREEIDEANSLVIYFQDVWNFIDWIVFVLLLILTVIRIVDIFLSPAVRQKQCGVPVMTCEIVRLRKINQTYQNMYRLCVF